VKAAMQVIVSAVQYSATAEAEAAVAAIWRVRRGEGDGQSESESETSAICKHNVAPVKVCKV